MPRPIARTSAALAALALAFPAAGMAQGAGDQQYSDPFTESQGGGNSGSGGGNQGGNQGSSGSGSSAPSQPQSSSGTTAQTPQSTPAPQASAQLPRTGYPAWPAALVGGVLLASGAMLRVSLGLRR